MQVVELFSFINNADPVTLFVAGSCVQLLFTLYLPKIVSVLPAIVLLSASWVRRSVQANNKIPAQLPTPNGVLPGRYTARIPGEAGSLSAEESGPQVVLFIVGVTNNHPHGRTAPGFAEVTRYFQSIWKDAEKEPEKWGYLGRTTPMGGNRPESRNIFASISYWRDVESLHALGLGPTHRAGWDWWNSTVKEHPHLGIFHEVYVIPRGHWTNTYVNFPPFAMGQTKVGKKGVIGEESPLVEARGSNWSGLLKRMAKARMEEGSKDE